MNASLCKSTLYLSLIAIAQNQLFMNAPDAAALLHRERFAIRSYEIDPYKRLTAPALIRLMQEASMQHVLQLKLSVWDLEQQGISWVLIRQRLHIERLPILGETIEVLTHPSGFERVFTHRDFRVFDADGAQIADASTTWLLMNTATRRMARIPAELLAYNELLPHPAGYLPRAADKLPDLGAPVQSRRFTVGWHNLDFNFHLTNSFYADWMLEAADEHLLQHAALQDIDMLYLAECVWNEELIAETSIVDDTTRLHRLLRVADGKELARARTGWES